MPLLTDWNTTQEILAQPTIWRAWASTLEPQLTDLRDWIAQCGATEVWFCGAGTSAYIGELVSRGLLASAALPLMAVPTTDLVSTPRLFQRPGCVPLVVSFGRSGNSAETIGTLDLLDAHFPDAPRLNITCNKDSALATRLPKGDAEQRVIVLPEACHDSGFAMTSSFTTMVLTALALFSPDSADRVADTLRQLANSAATMLPEIESFASDLALPDRVVFVGSGPLTFVARESALKVMELAAGEIPALWDSCLGFRHGPKSFVTKGTKVFVMLSNDPFTRQYDFDLAQEVKAQFGDDCVTTIGHGAEADVTIDLDLDDVWTGVLHVLVAQWLGISFSQKLNLNVDDPFTGRGTLTRVVSGVKLYELEPS